METKQITITANIIAKQFSWEKEPTYNLSYWDHESDDSAMVIGTVDVTVTVPVKVNMDEKRIAVLIARKKELSDEFNEQIKKINDQLAQYQALEFTPA